MADRAGARPIVVPAGMAVPVGERCFYKPRYNW